MAILDNLIMCDYDEFDIEEAKKEIDATLILTVYALEKTWELLQKSNLPDDVKLKILINNAENIKKEK